MKQHKIKSLVGRNIIILTTSQNLLNTLKEALNMYTNGRFYDQLKKNIEAIFIALYKPSLNNQKSFDRLMLFRNGIT